MPLWIMKRRLAFDRVPREVVWWALGYIGIDNGLIQVIQSMYNDPETTVKFKEGSTRFFYVKVSVHQGSVLSPLQFTIVLEAISGRFRSGLPFKLLCADDLALVAESKEKFQIWRTGLEAKV